VLPVFGLLVVFWPVAVDRVVPARVDADRVDADRLDAVLAAALADLLRLALVA